MLKLVIALSLVGIAYWLWTERQQQPLEALEAARLKENAATMQRCIDQEERMQSTGGLAGIADVGSGGKDAERLCAARNHLYQRDGHWYVRKD